VPTTVPGSLVRLERRKGEVARMLLALAAPPGDHPDHPALRLLTTLLAGGRTSRLHYALVDEGQLCSWVAADLSEGLDASQTTISAEVVPDVEPARVEAEMFRLLDDLFRDPPDEEEVERARQIATADWVFGHEKVHQQAISLGLAVALFDADHLDRHLRGLLETGPERLLEVADRYLRPERGAVLGWSLPRE
jgi:zinc protease